MQADEGAAATREPRSRIDHRTGKRVLVYDASFWQMHVAERRRLGQSVHTYCTAQGLALSTFRPLGAAPGGPRELARACARRSEGRVSQGTDWPLAARGGGRLGD